MLLPVLRDNLHCATTAAQCTRDRRVQQNVQPITTPHGAPSDRHSSSLHPQHTAQSPTLQRTASGVSLPSWQYPPHMGRASSTTQHIHMSYTHASHHSQFSHHTPLARTGVQQDAALDETAGRSTAADTPWPNGRALCWPVSQPAGQPLW